MAAPLVLPDLLGWWADTRGSEYVLGTGYLVRHQFLLLLLL